MFCLLVFEGVPFKLPQNKTKDKTVFRMKIGLARREEAWAEEEQKGKKEKELEALEQKKKKLK